MGDWSNHCIRRGYRLSHYVAHTCQQAGGWHSTEMPSCFTLACANDHVEVHTK